MKFADADTGINLNENCSPLHRLPVEKIVRNKGHDGVHTYRIPGMSYSDDQGSMISFIYHGKNVLAFSNPHVQKGRRNLTIQFSFDEGSTWLSQYNMLVDERSFFGYSSLVYTGDLLYTKFRLPF
ncbi:MAG: exo-alpha-sialidase [Sediminibacterium magnilacihabitans]|nr:exo-alpha-sialidase [Sediminibacterium magnilacihabitans]PQV61963.1 hypothetical protein CLV53_101237 [Sediminibacterium magnilacihabitans]